MHGLASTYLLVCGCTARQDAIEDFRLDMVAEEAELEARFSSALLSCEPMPHWHHIARGSHELYSAGSVDQSGTRSSHSGIDTAGSVVLGHTPIPDTQPPRYTSPALGRLGVVTAPLPRPASGRFQDARPPSLQLQEHSTRASDGFGSDDSRSAAATAVAHTDEGSHTPAEGADEDRSESTGALGMPQPTPITKLSRPWQILRDNVLHRGHDEHVKPECVLAPATLSRIRELQIAAVMELAVVINGVKGARRRDLPWSMSGEDDKDCFGELLRSIRPVSIVEAFIDLAFDMVFSSLSSLLLRSSTVVYRS
jgi:hypothetical protein